MDSAMSWITQKLSINLIKWLKIKVNELELGVRVLIDSKALMFVVGTEMDYVES